MVFIAYTQFFYASFPKHNLNHFQEKLTKELAETWATLIEKNRTLEQQVDTLMQEKNDFIKANVLMKRKLRKSKRLIEKLSKKKIKKKTRKNIEYGFCMNKYIKFSTVCLLLFSLF